MRFSKKALHRVHYRLESQVVVGVDEGLKQPSAIHCDAMISMPKAVLTN
jgi:hypothetical protein